MAAVSNEFLTANAKEDGILILHNVLFVWMFGKKVKLFLKCGIVWNIELSFLDKSSTNII